METKFKKALGITLIALVFLTIFGFMINQSGWIVFLKAIGITIAIIAIISVGVILAVRD
jgi:hypothetical protein